MARATKMKPRRLEDEGWDRECDACIRYASKELAPKYLPTGKEAGVACLYEFTRELIADKADASGFLEAVFRRRPFQWLIDHSPESSERLRSTPWLALPQNVKAEIMKRISYSYDKVDPESIWIPKLLMCDLTGVFEKFRQAANKNLEKFREAQKENNFAKLEEIVGRPAILPMDDVRDQVLMVIDYRHSKKAILSQIKTWLDTRDELFKKHSAELHGSRFFRDRLRDLANWRLHRRLKMKGVELLELKDRRYSPLHTKAYYQAKKNALKLTRLLSLSRFDNLNELEITFHRLSDEDWESIL